MTDKKKSKAQPEELPVDEAQQAMHQLTTDLQRVQADFVNFKRRIDSERGELMETAKAAVVEELLPLFDNLDRALSHTPSDLVDNAWVLGVEQVAKQVPESLSQLGIIAYGAVGDEFDPKLHEAIAHDGDGDHVTEVFEKGYRADQRVIRPARVKVGPLDKKEGEQA